MKKQSHLYFLVPGIAIVWIIDFISKYFAQQLFTSPVELTPFVTFSLSRNANLAFGIYSPMMLTVFFSIVAITFLIFIYSKYVQKKSKLAVLTFALIFGGALGNLFERIFSRSVVDFISAMGVPNFNLADAFITTGVIILIFAHKKVFLTPKK